jgi:hypothetical protein
MNNGNKRTKNLNLTNNERADRQTENEAEIFDLSTRDYNWISSRQLLHNIISYHFLLLIKS